MKKGIVALFFSMIFALVLGATGVFAADAEPSGDVKEALEEVEQTNAKIYKEIEKAQEKADKLYDKKLKDLGKAKDAKKQVKIEEKYEKKITKLIAELDKKTQDMTRKGVEKAEKAGLTVEIEWIPVQFADRVALIDPIKVLGW